MSSSTPIESLSALATLAETVEELFYKAKTQKLSRGQFELLKTSLNALQTSCPNLQCIVDARVRWVDLALDSLKNDSDDKMLARPDDIFFFIKRSYLKSEFPRLFTKTISTIRYIISNLPNFAVGPWESRIRLLETALLEGRL